MYKLEWVNPKTVPDYIEKFGGFNDFPPNWKQVTEQELFESGRLIYCPEYRDYRQMFRTGNSVVPMIDATLYFLPGGEGYAIQNDYFNKCFKYFTFAVCEHKFELVSQKGLERTYKCKKCSHTFTYDSSDCHSYS